MKRLVVVFLVGGLLGLRGFAQKRSALMRITDSQTRAIALAIEDEVYDRGYQKSFYMVGPEVRPDVTQIVGYVEPELKKDGGTVIYKLMPYGEVMRGFHFDKDGLAVLEGDPDGGFPPTDGDTLTLYMDDDDICRMKHSWKKLYFEIADSPSSQQVGDAATRQKERVGFSYKEIPPREQRFWPPRANRQ